MLVSKDVYVLINYTSFVESIFMGLSVIGLLYLRWQRPNMKRPIKVKELQFLDVSAFRHCFRYRFSSTKPITETDELQHEKMICTSNSNVAIVEEM